MKQAKSLFKHTSYLCAGLIGLVAVGCGKDEEIKVYSAPKETPRSSLAATAADVTSSTSAPTAPAKPEVSWKTPQSWKELAPTSMRVGNFSVTKGEQKAEIAILPFPGSIGGELENVNRWRGEIGLEPVKEGEYKAESVQVGTVTGKLYDLQGSKLSTVAAWLERDGVHWFIKMRGDKELVAENKPVLVEFLKTIVFQSPAQVAQPAQAAEEEEDHSAHDHGPKWDIPAHWKAGAQKPMVLKNWNIIGDGNAVANMAVSSFPGEVGGIVANVNRWRGQLNLPAMSTEEVKGALQLVETSDGHSQAGIVDFKGTDREGKPSRMVAAIVPHGGDTWFYKLTGDDALVEKEKAAFVKLVKTASYH